MNAHVRADGIREATLDDIPAIIAFAKDKYPDRAVEQGGPWLEWCINNPNRLVLIGPNSIGVAQVSVNYGVERKGKLDMLGARPAAGAALEALKMIRIMTRWAKSRGAVGTFRLSADTGVDFKSFSERLGGKPVTVTHYEIPLE